VSTGSNAYSVHPEAIGRMITVTATLDQVTVRCGDRVVADHERIWGTSGLVADPDHVAAASVLRQPHIHRRSATGGHLDIDVEVADVSAYDTVFWTRTVA
jgi:hypothetical protein